MHMTHHSLLSPRPKASLYDDYNSYVPLEANSTIDTSLANLREAFDRPLNSSPFVAPSSLSTRKDTTEGVLSLLASLFHLDQCTCLEMDESPGAIVSYVEDDLFDWLGDIALLESSFEELYSDDVRVSGTPSIKHIDPICTKSLDLTPISSHLFPTISSHLHAFHEPQGDIREYNPSFELCCAYLEDMLRKLIRPLSLIILSDFLSHSISVRGH